MKKVSYAKMDLTGQIFGVLTVIEQAPMKYGTPHWLCLCECGKTLAINYQSLVRGRSTNCGCVRNKNTAENNKTHGKTYTTEYNSWRGMKGRCYDPNRHHYSKYGGRGIRICAGWHHDFEAFVTDVGLKPSPKHSIDRIDNDGHYSCGHCEECVNNNWTPNCKWTEQKEQVRNRRIAINVTYNDKTMTLSELSEITGIPYITLHNRYRKGWALTQPHR